MKKYSRFKRPFDLCVTSIIVIIVLPICLIIFLCLWMCYGRPVIFKQQRLGYKYKPFLIYKFRTMTELKDKTGKPLEDKERLTIFGKILRKTSLDELPELWNVIKGDMSLVGPRALLMEYLNRYTAEQARRHEIKPGITGWAQVNGRNALSWEEKFNLDVWYVDNHNLLLDIRILFLTLIKVLKMEGITAKDHVTMPKFGEENAK